MPTKMPLDVVPDICAFERVRVIALRAAQLMEGCTALVPASERAVLTARREVDAGLIRRIDGAASTPAAGSSSQGR